MGQRGSRVVEVGPATAGDHRHRRRADPGGGRIPALDHHHQRGRACRVGGALLLLAVLAYLSQHLFDRNLALQAERQSSLLRAISDIGEGLVITENGRFVVGNAAYEALTGYDAAELAALLSLIELAAPDEQQHLSEQLATRLEGGDVPFRYESA